MEIWQREVQCPPTAWPGKLCSAGLACVRHAIVGISLVTQQVKAAGMLHVQPMFTFSWLCGEKDPSVGQNELYSEALKNNWCISNKCVLLTAQPGELRKHEFSLFTLVNVCLQRKSCNKPPSWDKRRLSFLTSTQNIRFHLQLCCWSAAVICSFWWLGVKSLQI